MFSPGIEPGTFCVLDRCDNRYTTKTRYMKTSIFERNAFLLIFEQFSVRNAPQIGKPGINGLWNCSMFLYNLFRQPNFESDKTALHQ